MKILIADDDSASRTILAKALKGRGECEFAESGAEVWDAYHGANEKGSPYDLIILDIQMPGMDGLEILRKIRAAESDRGVVGLDRVKIAMATCLDDKDNVLTAFRDQCDGYITKPYGAARIVSSLIHEGLL